MVRSNQKSQARTSRTTVKSKRPIPWSPAYQRERRAALPVFRRLLKQVDRWQNDPRYLGVTFPGIKDGNRLAEELVQFARDVVAGRLNTGQEVRA